MAQAMVVGMDGVRAGAGPRQTARKDAVSWRRAHEELVRIAKKRAGLDVEEGRWLLRALHAGTHIELGYGSFYEYTERLFGYGPRLTQEKIRVAEALAGLPETAEALETGSISFSAARELTRVAVPSTERAWLEAARGRTVREVEALVSGHRPGSLPDDVPDAESKRHVLRLEVSGEALATFREAMAKIRRDAGESLDDEAALLLMSRHVLEGPGDEGRSSYQVALTVCERCRRGTQQGRGELIEVSPEVVAMAECDGQHIGHVESHAELGAHLGSDEQRAKQMFGAHVGADEEPASTRQTIRALVDADEHRTRASQTIPPALRREVLRRDGGRCQVPGCRHATYVDVHHLRPRSDGGQNTRENLVTLCCAHHAALHGGKLSIEGTPSRGLSFSHADGTPYGHPLVPRESTCVRAYRALVELGFRESETRRAIARVSLHPDMTLERLVRQTLRELAPDRN
jgi:hypothetical protein